MITAAPFEAQSTASANDDLRILIVGAGIAGVTLAQLLRAQGRHPVLIDRSADSDRMTDDNHAGYMLALMPMVDPVIDDLGVREEYRRGSVGISRFTFHSHTGDIIRSDDLGELLSQYGDYRGISRSELIAALANDACPVAFDTSVVHLEETSSAAQVQVVTNVHGGADAASEAEFDLVVIADGLNSHTRSLVPGGVDIDRMDTAWGGWVAWSPADGRLETGDEVWGDGFFLGMYPVRDGIGVFLGCPDSRQPLGPRRFAAEVRSKLRTISPRVDACLSAVADARQPFFWPLRDVRTKQWTTGHTVLLGDAAAGFLPTAGIGAGMAMESAWVLAHSLSAAAPATLADHLRRFERLQRPRVEAAHDNSRSLAKLMFDGSPLLASLRDLLFRFISIRLALRPIISLLDRPPRP